MLKSPGAMSACVHQWVWVLSCGLLGLARGQAPDVDPSPYIVHPFRISALPERLHGFKRWFTKYVPVVSAEQPNRGVQIVATSGVHDAKMIRVANILAEYLDNDEDGEIDNPDVATAMLNHGSTMIMFATAEELDHSGFDSVPGYGVQDVEGEETADYPNRTLARLTLGSRIFPGGGEERRDFQCAHKPELICDATLEEVFHLVTDTGFGNVYPELATKSTARLARNMEKVIGDCGYNTWHVPWRLWPTHFKYPKCSGFYHYDDPTCSYECLATEYFHHFLASYNGEYAWHRRTEGLCNCSKDAERAGEWELCLDAELHHGRSLLQEHDPDGYALITNPMYRVPLKFPDGDYTPGNGSMLRYATRQAPAEGLPFSSFHQITLERSERIAHHAFHAAAVDMQRLSFWV